MEALAKVAIEQKEFKVAGNYLQVTINENGEDIIYGTRIKPIWAPYVLYKNIVSSDIHANFLEVRFSVKDEDGVDITFVLKLEPQKSAAPVHIKNYVRNFDTSDLVQDKLYEFAFRYGIGKIRSREEFDIYTNCDIINEEKSFKEICINKLYGGGNGEKGMYGTQKLSEREAVCSVMFLQHGNYANQQIIPQMVCNDWNLGTWKANKSMTKLEKSIYKNIDVQQYQNLSLIYLSYLSWEGWDPIFSGDAPDHSCDIACFNRHQEPSTFYSYNICYPSKVPEKVGEIVKILPSVKIFAITKDDCAIGWKCVSEIKTMVLHRYECKK